MILFYCKLGFSTISPDDVMIFELSFICQVTKCYAHILEISLNYFGALSCFSYLENEYVKLPGACINFEASLNLVIVI